MSELKIGDKINIKFGQEEKKTTIENTFYDILSALKSPKLDQNEKLKWCSTTFEILEEWFKENDLKSVRVAKERLIPILYNLVEKGSIENKSLFFDYYKRAYCFCASRDLESFIDYCEWGKPKKALMPRREVLKPLLYYLTKCSSSGSSSDEIDMIVASFPPSYGKSLAMNYYSALCFGININDSLLRISYSDDLVTGFSRSIKAIIESQAFAEVFPLFKLYNGKPFDKSKESDWQIKNSLVPVNHYARTRDGQITGFRVTRAIIVDDITKGVKEASNEAIHNTIYDQYQGEWLDRADSGNRTKKILVGTMWAPFDVLNRIREDEEKEGELIPDEQFKFTWKSQDGRSIFIRVPALDENDKSTAPQVHSTEYYLKKRRNIDPYLFACEFQQEPIAPSGLEFAWDNLQTFKELPKDMYGNYKGENYCMAVLDPSRRGKDFVSMPICKPVDNFHYVIDCLFKQKAMKELYDEVVEKIKQHNIIKLVVENNTDESLKTVLDGKLKEKGLKCEIIEKYSTKKKEDRIRDLRFDVISRMVFKDKNMVRSNTDYGNFMKNLTQYSFDFPNRHDDAPDSTCMYASEIIMGKSVLPKAKPFKRTF